MELEERAADPLAGGLLAHGYQCGMLWGSALAAGAEAYRRFGAGTRAETVAVTAARAIVDSFRAQNKYTNCFEITELDWTSITRQKIARYFLSGRAVSCFRMSAGAAHMAFSQINSAFSEKEIEELPAPASCAAMVAQKMGASEEHSVMAAGFAGGIGLSGGACGALGAAIWIRGMETLRDGGKVTLSFPRAVDAIAWFAKHTGHKFECCKIVGQKFESLGEHASYLREGGCAEIIEGLAADG